MLYKFSQHSKINENADAAKALLLKLGIEKKKNKLGVPPEEKVELSDKEKEKILKNPDFLALKEFFISQKKPNLIYPFTYFMMVEGLPMDSLGSDGISVKSLKSKLDEVSPILQTFPLPKGNDVQLYIKNKTDGVLAYENLDDDINLILSKKPIKEFVDNFVGPIRKEFSKSLELVKTDPKRKNLLGRLYHAVSDLKALPDTIDEKTGVVTTAKDAESQLIKHASKYKDVITYPEFSNTFVAFEDFINDIEIKISSWGLGDSQFLEELSSISPSIKILMYDPKTRVVVSSSRTNAGMVSVCKIANAIYCIRSESTFTRITAGKLQISINQLELPKSSTKYLIACTINPDGKITDSANRDNNPIHHSGESYQDFISRNIPGSEEIIKSIQKNFYSELSIKKIIESLKKRIADKKGMIFALGGIAVNKAIQEGEYSRDDINVYKNLVVSIIKKEMSISYEDVVSCFSDEKQGGFFTMEDVDLFIALTDGKYSKEDVNAILELTQSAIEYISHLVETAEDEKSIKAGKYLLDVHPRIAEYVQKNML